MELYEDSLRETTDYTYSEEEENDGVDMIVPENNQEMVQHGASYASGATTEETGPGAYASGVPLPTPAPTTSPTAPTPSPTPECPPTQMPKAPCLCGDLGPMFKDAVCPKDSIKDKKTGCTVRKECRCDKCERKKIKEELAGKRGVPNIIPHFETAKEWDSASETMRAEFHRANDYFKKAYSKKFKAQGAAREKASKQAEKALVKLKESKERIQKRYAHDNPADFGMGPLTSADKANKEIDANAEDHSSGSWGASGVPGHRKWYGNGVISSDSYVTNDGHYILGANRRRIGAGFGRRRRWAEPKASGSGSGPAEEDPTKGHDLLREGLGKMKKKESESETERSEATKTETKSETKKSEAKQEEEKLPAGVREADKSKLTAAEKKTLEATNAGIDAQVDSNAHFTKTTDDNVLGKEETDEIKGQGGATGSA
jgi:hypothetical protein